VSPSVTTLGLVDASPVPGLDTREFATLLWVLVGIGLAGLVPNVRKSLIGALTSLLHWKILGVLVAFCGYVLLIVWLLSQMNLWNAVLISETVFWLCLTGFVVLFRAAAGAGTDDFFARTLRGALAVSVLLEFVLGLRPLNVVLELLLQPVLFVLAGVAAFGQRTPDGREISAFAQGLFFSVLVFLIGYTVVGLVNGATDVASYDAFLEFILPILMTMAVVPFVYAVAFAFTLEQLFMRIDFNMPDNNLVRRLAKRRATTATRFRLSRARLLAHRFPWLLNPSSEPQEIPALVRRALSEG
jgi:hypothetical protein